MEEIYIGKQIKKFRESRGYTQETFAEMVELSTNYLSAIERGVKNPRLETLIRIINTLGVSANKIFSDMLDDRYEMKNSILSDEIQTLPPVEQRRIFAVVETMINEAKK